MFVTIDIISSLDIDGMAAFRRGSTFIEMVPPVNTTATFFAIKKPPRYLFFNLTT